MQDLSLWFLHDLTIQYQMLSHIQNMLYLSDLNTSGIYLLNHTFKQVMCLIVLTMMVIITALL